MRVYHFLPARWAEDDLANRRLKVARFDDLNDPFELLSANLKDREIRRAFQAIRDNMCANRGVLCFSRSWRNPLLWSHYADKHRRVCLGFDVPDAYSVSVQYDPKRLIADVPKLLAREPEGQGLMSRLLATKFRDWKYEREVRVYIGLETPDPVTGLYFQEFGDKLTLRAVILGARWAGDPSAVAGMARQVSTTVSVVQARAAFQAFKMVPNKSVVV